MCIRDRDNIFGLSKVEEWRRKMERTTGRQCIPVWHKGRGVEYWKKMCREYKYVAIGGLVFHVKKQEYELIKKLVHYAAVRGVKVHGLGFTKTKSLNEYEFYSVDSEMCIRDRWISKEPNTKERQSALIVTAKSPSLQTENTGTRWRECRTKVTLFISSPQRMVGVPGILMLFQ